jgi:hypothetical protein
VSHVSPVPDREVPPRSPAGGDDGGTNTRKDSSNLVAGGARDREAGSPRTGATSVATIGGKAGDREAGSPRTGATSAATIGGKAGDREAGSPRTGATSAAKQGTSTRAGPGSGLALVVRVGRQRSRRLGRPGNESVELVDPDALKGRPAAHSRGPQTRRKAVASILCGVLARASPNAACLGRGPS